MNIEIPDIPQSLNPHGWEVEVSSIVQCKEGEWPLYLLADGWHTATFPLDCEGNIRARLIEPKPEPIGEIQCPVCGYYCLGNGGRGCIDKPETLTTPTPEMEVCINEMMRPEQPANLPEGHVAAVAMEIIEYLIRQGTRKFK